MIVDDPARQTELRMVLRTAIDELPADYRAVVVLRYFSMAASYDAIATALGIPVGTVRSRLHDARGALDARLRELESSAVDDHTRTMQARERLFTAIVAEYNSGKDLGLLGSMLAAGARLTTAVGDDVLLGWAAITRSLADDLEAGVRLRLLRVVAGAGLTVVEGAFENPSDAPDHCPPFTTQVYRHRGDQVTSLHLAYSTAKLN